MSSLLDSLSGHLDDQSLRRIRKISEANRDQIKNPDLIYPGQTFTIPDA